MGTINWSKVVVGGLAAGVVVNISEGMLNAVVLADEWKEVMAGLGKSSDYSGGQIAMFNILGFAIGIFAVWLYAAIRPRYGAGPKTALCAGVSVWFIGYLMPLLFPLIMDVYPAYVVTVGLAVGLIEIVIGTLLGAKLYREQDVPASASGSRAAGA